VAVLAVALAARAPTLVTLAVALAGAAYAAFFLVRKGGAIDTRSPLYGTGLLLGAELAFAALERRTARLEPGSALRRIAVGAALAVVAVGLSALVLTAAAAPADGGVLLQALGLAAAVGALVLLAGLGRVR
jgi:hypothetical protein